MKKLYFVLAIFITFCLMSCLGLSAQDYQYEWKKKFMDGSRIGAKFPSASDIDESLGKIKKSKYYAPNGRVFSRRSMVTRAAKVMIEAQTHMVDVKEVIGYSTREMIRRAPESEISNWFVDVLMEAVRKQSGKEVHVGIANFGGIRADLPQGDIIKNDLISMFPFKNQIVYVEIPGWQLLKVLEDMAATHFQVLGGVKIVAADHKLISAEINGEAISKDKTYGLATISFLLNGGDNLYLSKNAVHVDIYDGIDVIDIILADVEKRKNEGRPIEYFVDGRVKILK